jgi:hypothetical protein
MLAHRAANLIRRLSGPGKADTVSPYARGALMPPVEGGRALTFPERKLSSHMAPLSPGERGGVGEGWHRPALWLLASFNAVAARPGS